MSIIKNMGRFCPTDVNGYIINESNIDNMNKEFLPVLEETVEHYKHYLGQNLHSLYVRGSIPRGLGLLGVSDLDTIAITHIPRDELNLDWVDKVEYELNLKYSCINGVELSFYPIEEIVPLSSFSIIPFMIKTHSICVYGENLAQQLPEFKADQILGNEHLIRLKKQIEMARQDLIGNDDREDILDCCTWIMKILIRAGLALIIHKERKYTRDLYPAYKLFVKHFPEKENEMRQALEYAIEPTDDIGSIIGILDNLGKWIIAKAETWLRVYNPSFKENMDL